MWIAFPPVFISKKGQLIIQSSLYLINLKLLILKSNFMLWITSHQAHNHSLLFSALESIHAAQLDSGELFF